MKRKLVGLIGGVLASALFSGCIGVYGTIRVVHVTEGAAPAGQDRKSVV